MRISIPLWAIYFVFVVEVAIDVAMIGVDREPLTKAHAITSVILFAIAAVFVYIVRDREADNETPSDR